MKINFFFEKFTQGSSVFISSLRLNKLCKVFFKKTSPGHALIFEAHEKKYFIHSSLTTPIFLRLQSSTTQSSWSSSFLFRIVTQSFFKFLTSKYFRNKSLICH